MDALHLVLAAAAGAVCLALAAAFWAAASRRLPTPVSPTSRCAWPAPSGRARPRAAPSRRSTARCCRIEGDTVRLAAGEDALPAIAALLGSAPSAPRRSPP